ncbi:MAG: auxin-binding protein [Woeseia sp.]|nr:auxin-binding protein [Woeseia sp.]|tara:strand:- start:269 stop:655 length:387 start_codon:yes stop_codon:yes gene_type:complete
MHKVMIFLLITMSSTIFSSETTSITRSGYFHISYQSELEPITINQIHNWVLHIETPEGDPVSGAKVSVSGGMPLHNHGLPTDPKVTTDLGRGKYKLEGLRFHMRGYWELIVIIEIQGRRDTGIVKLNI